MRGALKDKSLHVKAMAASFLRQYGERPSKAFLKAIVKEGERRRWAFDHGAVKPTAEELDDAYRGARIAGFVLER